MLTALLDGLMLPRNSYVRGRPRDMAATLRTGAQTVLFNVTGEPAAA